MNEEMGFLPVMRREEITPDMARRYLGMSIGNRPVDDRKARTYAYEMRLGEWMDNPACPLAFGTNGKLMNGHHRLQAIINANMTVPMYVVRNVSPECMRAIDIHKSRGVGDVMQIEGIPNSRKVAAMMKSCFGIEASVVISPTGYASKATMKGYLDDYMGNADFWKGILRDGRSYTNRIPKLLSESFVLGLMACLSRHGCRVAIYNFMDELYGTTENPMVAKLHRVLVNEMANNGAKPMKESYKQRMIAKVWNNYVKGKTIANIKLRKGQDDNIWFYPLTNIKRNSE